MQDFRKLRAWRKAQAFAVAIHQLVQTFPKKGFSRLKSQMKKSAEAIPDTIAEGCGASTQADFARLLAISLRESSELENHLDRAWRFGLVNRPKWIAYTREVRTIRKMTLGLRNEVARTYRPDALQSDDGSVRQRKTR